MSLTDAKTIPSELINTYITCFRNLDLTALVMLILKMLQ